MPQKDMTGALNFQQEKKSQNSPDLWGSVTINRVRYKLSGWNKVNQQDGNQFVSLAVQPYEQSSNQQGGFQQPQQNTGATGGNFQQQPQFQGQPVQQTAAPQQQQNMGWNSPANGNMGSAPF